MYWSWAWINRSSPSKGVGLYSPLAACSVYGDLNRSEHTVNIFSSVSNYQTHVCHWSWAWINRSSPSKGVGLYSPLAACSVYGDLNCSEHTVNIFSSVSNYQTHICHCMWGPYVRLALVPNMLYSWNKVVIIIIIIITIITNRFS